MKRYATLWINLLGTHGRCSESHCHGSNPTSVVATNPLEHLGPGGMASFEGPQTLSKVSFLLKLCLILRRFGALVKPGRGANLCPPSPSRSYATESISISRSLVLLTRAQWRQSVNIYRTEKTFQLSTKTCCFPRTLEKVVHGLTFNVSISR